MGYLCIEWSLGIGLTTAPEEHHPPASQLSGFIDQQFHVYVAVASVEFSAVIVWNAYVPTWSRAVSAHELGKPAVWIGHT